MLTSCLCVLCINLQLAFKMSAFSMCSHFKSCTPRAGQCIASTTRAVQVSALRQKFSRRWHKLWQWHQQHSEKNRAKLPPNI